MLGALRGVLCIQNAAFVSLGALFRVALLTDTSLWGFGGLPGASRAKRHRSSTPTKAEAGLGKWTTSSG